MIPLRIILLVLTLQVSISAAAVDSTDVIISDTELMQVVFGNAADVKAEQITLTPVQRDWSGKRFRFAPPEQTVQVWLSRDASGQVLAGLIKADVSYQGQIITVALGLSAEVRVIRAAITSVPESLRQQLESTIGIGYLKRYTMMSARQLGYLANVLKKEGPPAALVAEQLFKSGAILAAIIKSAE